jgi:hypothetical protein
LLERDLRREVAYADVEEHLPEPVMVTVRAPRQTAISQWREALERSLDELTASNRETQILTCHLTLFNGLRSEFYSAVDPRLFAERDFIPHSLVILFDDVYDMFRRLSVEAPDSDHSGIFSEKTGEARFREFVTKKLRRTWAELSSSEHALLWTEYRVQALTQLLAWRRAEMVQAELLASQLACSFLPYATKHNIEGLANVCTWDPDDLVSVYVSHPISRLRESTMDGGAWSPMVRECNKLPQLLAKKRCIPIMPTAIDEFRLQQGADQLFQKPPVLSRRWPKAAGELVVSDDIAFSDELCYCLQPDDYPNLPNKEKTSISALMRALEAAIQAEVPFRDHLIVAHSDALLVFRPFVPSGRFSGGVLSEIQHWVQLATMPTAKRRIAFIHTLGDVQTALEDTSNHYLAPLRTWFEDRLKEKLSARHVECMPDHVDLIIEKQLPNDLLSHFSGSHEELMKLRGEALTEAMHLVLKRLLTGIDPEIDNFENVGVFLVSDMDDLEDRGLRRVIDFILGNGGEDDVMSVCDGVREGGILAWGESLLRESLG